MRYDDNAYLEVFPREDVKPQISKSESACEEFHPSNEETVKEDKAVETVEVVEEKEDGLDGADYGSDT